MDRNGGCVALVGLIGVAPLAGSVDRNPEAYMDLYRVGTVAPLAGSVDRNSYTVDQSRELQVAPLAGSVDRNYQLGAAV